MTVKNSVFGRKCVQNRKSSYSFGRSLASDEVCAMRRLVLMPKNMYRNRREKYWF